MGRNFEFVVAQFCGVLEEIRRNTQAKTPSKNPKCDVHYCTFVGFTGDESPYYKPKTIFRVP